MLSHLRRGCSALLSMSQQQHQVRRWRVAIPWYEKPRTQKPVHVCLPDTMPKYRAGFNDIPELENASEAVQKIFSLEMGDHHDLRAAVSETNKKIYGSKLEQRVADKTHMIRNLTEHLRKYKKDTENKQYFIALIQKRKKLLRKLQERDAAAYLAIIEKMEIPALQSSWLNHNKYRRRVYKINVPVKKKREIDDFEEELVV